MEIRANYIMVGLFTLLVLLGGVAFTLWIGNRDKGVAMIEYDISFNESVSGLSVNNDVLFTGIRVGKVTQITISRVTPGEVRVRVTIAADTPVRENSFAQLEMRGITGISTISISGGTADSPLIQAPEGSVGVIKYRPSPLSSVVNQVPELLVSINQVMSRIDRVFSDENINNLNETIASLAKVSTKLAEKTDTFDSILATSEKAVGNLETLLANANELVAGDIKATTQSIKNLTARMASTLAAMEPGLKQFSTQGLPETRMLMVEARSLVQMLTRLSQKLESDPRRFLFGDTVKEYRN